MAVHRLLEESAMRQPVEQHRIPVDADGNHLVDPGSGLAMTMVETSALVVA
jgi:hypothetical protein